MTAVAEVTVEASLDALVDAADELAASLGFDGVTVLGHDEAVELPAWSSYVPLVGDNVALQVGISADDAARRGIAAALLGLEADEVDPEDAIDAVGEAVNILAGQVKTRLVEVEPSLKLGLPMFVEGHVLVTPSFAQAVAHVQLGTVPVSLVALRHRKRPGGAR